MKANCLILVNPNTKDIRAVAQDVTADLPLWISKQVEELHYTARTMGVSTIASGSTSDHKLYKPIERQTYRTKWICLGGGYHKDFDYPHFIAPEAW